jgi:hypothetical protein
VKKEENDSRREKRIKINRAGRRVIIMMTMVPMMWLMIIMWRIRIRDRAAGRRGGGKIFQSLHCSIMLFLPNSYFICNLIRILGRITIRPTPGRATLRTPRDSFQVYMQRYSMRGLSGLQLIRVLLLRVFQTLRGAY